MAYAFTEDNGSSYFTLAANHCNTNFDFFDLGLGCSNEEASDASISHGSTSTDINLFDDLSMTSVGWERDFSATCTDVFPSISSTISPFTSASQQKLSYLPALAAPKIQRLNKDTVPLTAFRQPIYTSPPSTPPATPHSNHTQPTTSPSKRSHRMHRVEKKPGHARSVSRPTEYRSGSPCAMATAHKYRRNHATAPSSPCIEWTERLRRLVIQSPQPIPSYPISPPLSTKINQTEKIAPDTNDNLGFGNGTTEDVFGVSTSRFATTSSTDLRYPSADDIYPSASDSSPWELDGGIKLFGIKQDPWDFTTSDIHHGATNIDLNRIKSPPPNHYNSLLEHGFDTSSDGGLGICFANGDFSSQVYGSIVEPRETQLPTSVKLPAMPFNTPVSDFGSPALCSNLPMSSNHSNDAYSPNLYPTLSVPAPVSRRKTISSSTPTTPKHRRNKLSTSSSSASIRGADRGGPSGSKVRNGRTPKAGVAAGGLGFVNFTPEDKDWILTGVAPSGSSKTKARREKEALDRRRKLSEAARRLVSEAGGDVNAVDRELSD